jgi:hypothetical protein
MKVIFLSLLQKDKIGLRFGSITRGLQVCIFLDHVQQRCRNLLEGVYQELRREQAGGRCQVDLPQEGHEYELSTSLDCRQYARKL